MKKRRIFGLIIFLTVTVLSVFFVSTYGYLFRDEEEKGHLASIFFDLNNLNVHAESEILPEITILWNDRVVFENGRTKKPFPRYEYGENIFEVHHGGKLVKQYSQYKFNNWAFFDYDFFITKESGKITARMEISGKDAVFRENPIDEDE